MSMEWYNVVLAFGKYPVRSGIAVLFQLKGSQAILVTTQLTRRKQGEENKKTVSNTKMDIY